MYKNPNIKIQKCAKAIQPETLEKVKKAAAQQMAATAVDPSIWY